MLVQPFVFAVIITVVILCDTQIIVGTFNCVGEGDELSSMSRKRHVDQCDVPTPKRKRRDLSEKGRALFSSGVTKASPLVQVSLLTPV